MIESAKLCCKRSEKGTLSVGWVSNETRCVGNWLNLKLNGWI